jgi:regulation of enolase protein 1 (concanavalin A-like superfamily)
MAGVIRSQELFISSKIVAPIYPTRTHETIWIISLFELLTYMGIDLAQLECSNWLRVGPTVAAPEARGCYAEEHAGVSNWSRDDYLNNHTLESMLLRHR